jgi:carbon-monoxide dehydrogenase medium subunit
LAPPLLALDAEAIVKSAKGQRTISLEKFFLNPGENVMKVHEILTEFHIKILPPHTGTAFMKLGRTAEDLAKINAAATIGVSRGVCNLARITLGAVAPTPMRARKAEKTLLGKKLNLEIIEDAARQAADETKPVSDTRSTAKYRKEVSRVIVERIIKIALERAK